MSIWQRRALTRADATPQGGLLRHRLVRHGVGAGLAVVLVAMAGVSAAATARGEAGGHDAEHARQISDGYQQARFALAELELQRHELQTEPAAWRAAAFGEAQEGFSAALRRVVADDSHHAGTGERLRAGARAYEEATAVDLSTLADVEELRLDRAASTLVELLQDASEQHRREAEQVEAGARGTQSLALRLVLSAFVLGVALLALFAAVLRAYGRRDLQQATHDSLTGLANRRLLATRLDDALTVARRDSRAVGLLLLDVDRFKEVNDTFGHHFGDALLVQVGSRLTRALREHDTVARLGGDEFAVVLPGLRSDGQATAVAQELKAALHQPFLVEGVEVDMEVSVGVTTSHEPGDEPDSLLRRADSAMYVAKTQRLGVASYDPAGDLESPSKLALLGDLRRCLARDELVVHYQPKVSIASGRVIGVEALVRWQHPERGLLSPDAFIPLAEQTGLIGPLTQQVLEAAVRQARTWLDAGRPLRINVNVSARDLLDERLPERVADLLALHGVSPHLLTLEVTESALIVEPARAQRVLEALAATGVGLSVDDFGAGYTSLGQLRTMPVDELKIDRSFVMTMEQDEANASIVRNLVHLGHELGMVVVAEGVESERVRALLADCGCDLAQGYLYSRPVPADELDSWRRDQESSSVPAGATGR